MKLAKPHLDIGLFSNDLTSQRKFWGTTAGLPLDHELELEPGWIQHRFAANGSIVKVNHLVRPLPELPASGYVGLAIAQDRPEAWSGQHPGGDAVDLVAAGEGGVVGIRITVASANPGRLLDFYRSALEFEPVDDRTSRCGDSLVTVVEGAGGSDVDDVIGPGFRYITIQVFDVDAEAAEVVRRGGRVAREPVNYAGVARYGFIADPDGNWIELSARTSLTGIQVS